MESFVSQDGIRIAYLDQGRGPAVLLLHGLTANVKVNWVEPGIVDALNAEGYRVIAIDMRGHDNSDAPSDPAAYHPDAIASDSVGLVKQLGAEPVAIVGYSYGCRTAAIIASDRALELSALVLAGTDLETTLYPHPQENPMTDALTGALLADDPSTVQFPGFDQMVAQLDEWNANHHAIAHIYRGMQQARPLDLGAIAAPALVINCPQEPDPAVIADLVPGAKTARLAAGTHLTGPKEPDWLPQVLGFLKEHVGGA
ncbi:MAG TPA: alpha/beta fold hydrolase [Acidimicrobiales bacterium]|nr:alpha/beta fold hydrolase [Acidimicrobiales bacterium]